MKREQNKTLIILKNFILRCVVVLVLTLIVAGCSGGSSGSGTGSGTGELSVNLADATTDEYNAVYVTIDEVQVHMAGGDWKQVAAPYGTYNLLELVNGVRAELGIAVLATGDYTQMRMLIGFAPDNNLNILSQNHPYANYVIDEFDDYHELTIPSGYQTGVKLVKGFSISQNQTTELILDFNALRSVVKAGNSKKWLLKPTIKVLDTYECSIISGIVTDDSASPLEGVIVSVQTYDLNAMDPRDEVTVQTSTISDEDGFFTIFLESGSYNIVSYTDGYNLSCSSIVVNPDSSHGLDPILSATSTTGTISGDTDILVGGDEQYVTISFRQIGSCSGSSDAIEIKSINVAKGGQYSVLLPEGTYNVVASTYGKITQSHDVDVTANSNTDLDIVF